MSAIRELEQKGIPLTRHLAIGDIHGCYKALNLLIEYVDPAPEDTLVTLGDYIDRGPDSSSVLDFLISYQRTHKLVPLRGNHEIMMLDARDKKSWLEPWLRYGGRATLDSYGGSFESVPEQHFSFLEQALLPYYESEKHFFVHANAKETVPLEKQDQAALYWRRYSDPAPHCSGKTMVCGHTPQQSGFPVTNGHSICLDTAVFKGGWLTCLDVDSGAIWQANESGEKRSLSLEEV